MEQLVTNIQWVALTAYAVLAVWAYVDLFKNPNFQGGLRLLMGLVILVPPVGLAMYWIMRDAKPKSRFGKDD